MEKNASSDEKEYEKLKEKYDIFINSIPAGQNYSLDVYDNTFFIHSDYEFSPTDKDINTQIKRCDRQFGPLPANACIELTKYQCDLLLEMSKFTDNPLNIGYSS